MSRYRVADNTQVNVDGTVYGPGETFEADADNPLVARWVAGGIVSEAPKPSKKAAPKK